MIKTLNVTNGDLLTERLLKHQITGDFATWREMLCEGKTEVDLASDAFRKARIAFFKKNYPEQAATYDDKFGCQLAIIADAHQYDEIVLWFEYDLFCHINMIACISFLKSLEYGGKIFLVCSGWVEHQTQLYGLSQLTDAQLRDHYKNKVLLNSHDIFLADDLWRLYCGQDHLPLNPKRAQDSHFLYLSNCLCAHKERFPHKDTGLNTLETNMLRLIRKYNIKTKHQLCGYMLNYQGYYGYGDLQILKMIDRMSPFFTMKDDHLVLTDKAVAVLDKGENVVDTIRYACELGGVLKYDYSYNCADHQLTKL